MHPCKYIIIHTTLHMYAHVNTILHYIILYTHKYVQHIWTYRYIPHYKYTCRHTYIIHMYTCNIRIHITCGNKVTICILPTYSDTLIQQYINSNLVLAIAGIQCC